MLVTGLPKENNGQRDSIYIVNLKRISTFMAQPLGAKWAQTSSLVGFVPN